MAIRRSHVHQTIAALVAIGFAYGWFFWGTHLAGRWGILLLVLTVPAGVLLGWLTMKLFEFADRTLNE
jgi:hypothetical protein